MEILIVYDALFLIIIVLNKLSDSVAWRKPYQDIQDFRMYRMNFLVTVLNKLSESGYPGFQDVQDEFSSDNFK